MVSFGSSGSENRFHLTIKPNVFSSHCASRFKQGSYLLLLLIGVLSAQSVVEHHAHSATPSDAGDIISKPIFPPEMGRIIVERIQEIFTAFVNTFQWFGSFSDWLWAFGLSASGIFIGSVARHLFAKSWPYQNRQGALNKFIAWLGKEISFFALAALFFAFVPQSHHVHGMAVAITASYGFVLVARSLTELILKIDQVSNSLIVRDVGRAMMIVAAGYIFLGIARLSDASPFARVVFGLAFWLVFQAVCSLIIVRIRSAAQNWHVSDIVADPVSSILLGHHSLFFGFMLLMIGVATVFSALFTGPQAYAAGVLSIIVLALLPAAIKIAPLFIHKVFVNLGPWTQATTRSARLIIFLLFWLLLSMIWGINPFDTSVDWIGHEFGRAIIDVSIAVVIAYLLWEIMHTGLDIIAAPRKNTIPGEEASHPPSATRLQTFIPLIRAMLLGFIFAATGMIVLAALGVNIGPLLAGAGIFGVAIGFGSQSLVKDVISGIFFLADDAFRIGEFVELGSAKGAIEAITIRSLKLRHSRGALYTVPFGSIDMVTNHSRDYVIVKLDFTVAFDTDLMKAKKLVKEINNDLESNEELRNQLLQPLKFQGVRRMEQYGMVVGVKFTARPGEQWVLRREVYQRISNAFNKSGIAFARPQVMIQVPEGAQVSNSAIEAAASFVSLNNNEEKNKIPE